MSPDVVSGDSTREVFKRRTRKWSTRHAEFAISLCEDDQHDTLKESIILA